ncbi:MAG: hypothetical protein CMJ83_10305 [Planctomycetes bacterium]|nr:hypothetical protein [Planctomycetota bacterium]
MGVRTRPVFQYVVRAMASCFLCVEHLVQPKRPQTLSELPLIFCSFGLWIFMQAMMGTALDVPLMNVGSL